jgi:20S proteasome subunit beta 1
MSVSSFPGFKESFPADWLPQGEELSTGTTLVAVEYDGGVVIGADSRTSMGSWVAVRVTDKLTPVTDSIFCCRSGSAADTQAVTDVVKYKLGFAEIEQGRPATVKDAAMAFKEICYEYRDSLMAGLIVAGYDDVNGGQVWTVPVGGMVVHQPMSIGGSGSTYLYGLMDHKFRPGMPRQECEDLVLQAVTQAIRRDGSSGGCCRMAIISKAGVERKLWLNNELPTTY